MDFSPVDQTDTAKEIEAEERAWMAAWLEKDIQTCSEILDEGFILTSATGILMDKSEWLDKASGAFAATEFRWLSICCSANRSRCSSGTRQIEPNCHGTRQRLEWSISNDRRLG